VGRHNEGVTPSGRAQRPRVAVGLAPLALIAAIVLSQVDHGPRALVGMPAANASPAQVVETDVRALDAHDFHTAERLLVPAVRTEYRRTWFADVDHVTSVVVGRVSAERPTWSGQNHRTQVMRVPVTWDVRWRFVHRDSSLPEGRMHWGFLLSRGSDRKPWRIFDQGTG
jgi:hypothetical protein